MGTLCGNERRRAVIPVLAQPEPADFASLVRSPGQAFLRRVPHPTREEFKKKSLWKGALPQLKAAHNNICAYSSCWVPNNCSVDHFRPKSTHPHLAYEWSNYRLAHDRINSNKGDSSDVLDPFHIQLGWFILDAATLWVKPEPSLPVNISTAVQRTIDVLRLNDDTWVLVRFEVFKEYLDREIMLGFLRRRYPFIAAEISRQRVQPKP
jgi:hypothetical protein